LSKYKYAVQGRDGKVKLNRNISNALKRRWAYDSPLPVCDGYAEMHANFQLEGLMRRDQLGVLGSYYSESQRNRLLRCEINPQQSISLLWQQWWTVKKLLR